ncbi:hypothetical protein ABZ567_18425 [Streptomyces sp. NPDC016459]|uniref:hypothetical protein n=1 Tax=Streptomyces sp. NPDC016459 TaxID=3157190 RepID=UPI0033E4CEB7
MERFDPGGGHPVTQAVQTNATLIDADWCALFTEARMQVGVSIDGPDQANAARIDRGGRASTDKALRGVGMLRREGIEFGLICVVADPTSDSAVALYRFAREIGGRRAWG